ncbi:MAG: NAD(P)-dependent oxidoreductase [Muribaculaceae bacterium]|nr:NAD(P)-dependent oxidoreductase [Muribaculaceae bacterium]MDE5924377.1 NAD(P)-dependent oxidoreductase [Muribaculaceae bacterium]
MTETTDKQIIRRQRVLIVGAGGFAGGFIVEEALRRGLEVWAGVRATTSRRYLSDKRIRFVEFDFDNPGSLAATMTASLPEGESWDRIVYNLGATKCLRFADFNRINYEYLRDFLAALKTSGKMPGKFLYISSLSAVGPMEERTGLPITERTIPQPNTRYGASKLKAEMLLQMEGIPYIILRATGIYGPRDRDYFLMFESIAKGWDFSVGYRRQTLTFLYVEDLARAVFDALEKSPVGETYNVAHPAAYSQAEFRKLAAKALGKKLVVPVRVPLIGLKIVSAIAEKIGVAQGKPSTLNRDKYNIMAQRNWSVDVGKAEAAFGFAPAVDLAEGIEKSVEWYKSEGWL